jgi:hypothetical protein
VWRASRGGKLVVVELRCNEVDGGAGSAGESWHLEYLWIQARRCVISLSTISYTHCIQTYGFVHYSATFRFPRHDT